MTNNLWTSFIADNSTNTVLVASSADGVNWSGDVGINETSQSAPSLAVLNNRLYVAFIANNATNDLLVASSADGVNWTGNANTGQLSKFAPSLAVFNNRLYVAFIANNPSNSVLVASSADGVNWSGDVGINETSQSAPSLAVFNNRLYVAFIANNATNDLLVASSADGANWTANANTGQLSKFAPSLAAGPVSGAGFASIVSQQLFATMFPQANSLYTYAGLVAATQSYPSFCTAGTAEQNGQEAAAFLANVAHETGQLTETIENYQGEGIAPGSYCQSSSDYPCSTTQPPYYYGRGPLQLSYNYNYGSCGQALGLDLLGNPDLVLHDSTTTFKTALWFWMTTQYNACTQPQQQSQQSCHDAILNNGFGATICIINGGLECSINGKPPKNLQEQQDRINYYTRFASLLNVAPGSNLSC